MAVSAVTHTPEELAMASKCGGRVLTDRVYAEARRRFVADATGISFDEHLIRVAGEHAALLAIQATTEAAAKLADRYHAACVPSVTIGDDDSIHLTEYEEGEKRAAYVIRENLRDRAHLKGNPHDSI